MGKRMDNSSDTTTQLKIPIDEFVAKAPLERIRKLRIWFILLVLFGLTAMAYVLLSQLRSMSRTPASPAAALGTLFMTPVYAHAQENNQVLDGTFRPYVSVGVFCLLAIVLLASLAVSLFSSNARRVTIASDVVKTVLGFFIGLATGFMQP
ncbi:MAG: hypothetical protein ACE5IY_17660 [bacterium]